MGRQISWIHLSDLHACNPRTGWDAARVRSRLLDDLRRLQKEHLLRPDFLFFTGDLAFGQVGDGHGLRLKDQLREGGKLLEHVCAVFRPKIPHSRVFLVPGNHDVNRDLVTPDQTYWLDQLRTTDDVISMLRDGGLHLHRLMERLHDYRDFLRKQGFLHLLPDVERLTYARTVRVRGVSVGVAGLNSAWSCCRDGEKGRLWIGGSWQAETLSSKLSKAAIRIALIHHPPQWFAEPESTFWRHIICEKFEFCLHGHEHAVWVENLTHGHSTIAAAACYDRSDNPKGNGYNIVRLDIDEQVGEVWLRRYDPAGGGWIPNLVAEKTDDRGVWPIRDFDITRSRGTGAIHARPNSLDGSDERTFDEEIAEIAKLLNAGLSRRLLKDFIAKCDSKGPAYRNRMLLTLRVFGEVLRTIDDTPPSRRAK